MGYPMVEVTSYEEVVGASEKYQDEAGRWHWTLTTTLDKVCLLDIEQAYEPVIWVYYLDLIDEEEMVTVEELRQWYNHTCINHQGD